VRRTASGTDRATPGTVTRGATALALAVTAAALGVAPGGPAPAPASAAPPADDPVAVVAAAPGDVSAAAADMAAGMDARELAGTVVMGHVGTQDPAAAARYLDANGIGAFLLMGANVPADETALRALTAALRGEGAAPPLLAIDEEGGVVTRLPWDDFPAGGELAAADPAAAETAFAARGALVARAGAGVNFGVVADVTGDASSFIAPRVLGSEPRAAAERVAAATAGEAPFALTTLKHFPGHGQVAADSHHTIPVADQSYADWRESTARPFEAGIDAGAPLVMTGHLVYPDVDDAPASLSPAWHRILREELGFGGVVVTDDLGMLLAGGDPRYADPVANAVAAVASGADLVVHVVGSGPETAGRLADGIARAVADGTLPEDRLREAAERVLALRLRLGAQTVLLPAD
jgi:beta-N-acetylhexosaminidase